MEISKQREFKGHSAGIYALDFDGKFIYSGSADGFVTRWDLDLGIQDKFAINLKKPVYSICLVNSAEHLAVGLNNGDLHIFDLKRRSEIKYFTQHKSAVFCIVENSHQSHIYSADADGNLAVWNSQTFELLLYLPFNCGKIRRVSVSSDGKYIALACQDGKIRILETDYFNQLTAFFAHKDGATSCSFHPLDSNILFSGGKDAILRQWNWNESKLLKEIPAHNFVIYDILSLKENLLLTSSRDKSIKLWDLVSLNFITKLEFKHGGHKHSVNCLLKMSDTTFCSASDDKKIVFWKISDL